MSGEIEYASNPDTSKRYARELFTFEDPITFWTSICRVEVGPVESTGNILDDMFRITQRGSTILTEVIGGFTIFFTIAYVMTTNGIVLEGTGIPNSAVLFSTCLASGIFSWAMGLTVNLPVVLGPSLALNVLFREVASVCEANPNGDIKGVQCDNWGVTSLPWSDTLGVIFLSGWFYLFFTVCGLRGYIYEAVPKSLRAAITVGTGLFITMVGLKIGQITRFTVRSKWMDDVFTAGACNYNNGDITCSDPVDLNVQWYNQGIAYFADNPYACIAVLGLIFASALEMFKIRGSLIISIWLATFVGINMYRCNSEKTYHDDAIHKCVTDLSLWDGPSDKIPFLVDVHNIPAGKMTFKYADTPFFWRCVFSFFFFEIFDSYGALTGIISRMGDVRQHPTVAVDRVNRAMIIDGFGVWIGSIIGCNSIAVYIESNTAVEIGARTGLTAIITGSLLLLSMLFIYPFVAIIPPSATTCVLVMVGVYTIQEYKNIDTSDYIQLFSAFVTVAIMGFTYSITNGICIGFIFYTFLQLLAYFVDFLSKKFPCSWWLKVRDGVKVELPHPVMIVTAAFMALRFELLKQQ